MKKLILLTFFILMIVSSYAQKQVRTSDINWERFLSQHDLVWDTLRADYYSGAILGNGLLGTNFYSAEDEGYRLDIGRSDVTEKRQGDNTLFHQARLTIGNFFLKTRGKVKSENVRLSLWDAVARGELITDKGRIDFESYVDANHDIIVFESTFHGDEKLSVRWNPEKAISSRTTFNFSYVVIPEDYANNPNPEVELTKDDLYNYSIQQLYSGWVYVTAWHIIEKANKQDMYVTVSFERSKDAAIKKAKESLDAYIKGDQKSLKEAHKAWWRGYYPASYVTFPNAMMESFYWIQQYKFACLTRQDKNIIDLMGPWTTRTPWPAIWWNLNIQLTYSPLFTANRCELSEPVWRAFQEHLGSLINNVPVEEWRKDAACIGRSSSYELHRPLDPALAENNQYEVGNLTWMLYYYWQYCIYKADEQELINSFFPLLKKSIAYYQHILYKGEDNKLHLPLTASPEYKPAKDCNYDLSLLRWGINTLIDIDKRYGINDSELKNWENIRANLVGYPTDEKQGYMIGKDVKLESSHRHYSHLLMIYPLHLINWEQPENRDLIQRSLDHWLSMKGALQGYTFTGSSSMYSMMGDGEKAVHLLEVLLNKYIRPNTLYRESGPVIETPLSAAASLQELYLQSWNGIIRVFPAVPYDWKDAFFINFRTEGGYLISAVRKNAATSFIQIENDGVDGKCRVRTGMNTDNMHIRKLKGKASYSVIDKPSGLIEIEMKKGDIVQIADKSGNQTPSFIFEHNPKDCNYYGVRK